MDRLFEPMSWGSIRILAGVILICSSASLRAEEPKLVAPDEALSAATSKTPPDYPLIAKQMKITGSVEVKVRIEEDGTVKEVSIVSGNPILAKAAIDAVKRWKFKPFKTEGTAVKVVSNLTIAFKVTD